MRQKSDSELEMELIPRQSSIGIESASASSSGTSTPSSSTKSSNHHDISKFIFHGLEDPSTTPSNMFLDHLKFWCIPLIFALATFFMYIVSTNAPPLTEDNSK